MNFTPKINQKQWNFLEENELLDLWKKNDVYKFNTNNDKVFSIDTPPPYVNTAIHIGHAYVYVLLDIVARSKRMLGYNVLFPLGLDKNGLPIEVQTEKEFNISIHDTPREKFLEKCKELLNRYGDISIDSFRRLGLSCNSWNKGYDLGQRYETDDPEYRKLTQTTFIKMWEKGLIYEANNTTNFCPVCKTAISNAEIEYENNITTLYYIKFQLQDDSESLIVATTRPELLYTVKKIIYNPKDTRYTKFKNKKIIVPISNHITSIIEHPYAQADFGSGLVMISSFGDQSDIKILRELEIAPTYAIDSDGKMNNNAKNYEGLSVLDARNKIAEDLESMNLIVKKQQISNRKPICERSKDPIEFIAKQEIYLKQVDYKEQISNIIKKTQFYAPESKQILDNWIDSINIDWVLSRRRYYGTEIPLWWCKNCRSPIIPKPGKYYQPWKDNCPVDTCPKCKSNNFEGETRIFDTWFDSCTSEAYILGYLSNNKFFNKNFPCSMRLQGKEIVRNWLYFTILKSLHLFDMSPFENILIHMHVVDEKGDKMSKSVGNVIDPQQILSKYGAECFRIWSCLEGDIIKGDIRCSYSRIDGQSKFLTKFWNIARFISMFPVVHKNQINNASDLWILSELSNLTSEVLNKYENYEFHDVAILIRDFTWNTFASHYVELVKSRAYGDNSNLSEQKSAWFTLHICIKNILLLFSPITPFITDSLWRQLYGKDSIHVEKFPKPEWDKKFSNITNKLFEFNSLVWNTKKSQGNSLKASIQIDIPQELEGLSKDLKKMHNIC